MKRLAATRAGTSLPNEDRAGTSGRLLWVVDGAMDPSSRRGSARFAQGLSDRFDCIGYRLEAEDPDDVDLTSVLAEAIATNPSRDTGCSASVALSFHSRDRTEMLVLGDATALAFRLVEDERIAPLMIHDARVNQVAVPERHAVREALDRGEDHRVVQCLQRELVMAENQMLNHPDGFWAAAADPAVASEAVTASLPRRNPLLLATQGVPGLFGRVPTRILDAYDDQELSGILDELHARVADHGPVPDMAVAVAAPHATRRF